MSGQKKNSVASHQILAFGGRNSDVEPNFKHQIGRCVFAGPSTPRFRFRRLGHRLLRLTTTLKIDWLLVSASGVRRYFDSDSIVSSLVRWTNHLAGTRTRDRSRDAAARTDNTQPWRPVRRLARANNGGARGESPTFPFFPQFFATELSRLSATHHQHHPCTPVLAHERGSLGDPWESHDD